jgi:hypothetical protein
MKPIHVPRPPRSSMDSGRPASSLLINQVEHMHIAEKRLPLRYRTDIYVNAIKTEGEAAGYIAEVTAAIHRAHADAAKKRIKLVPRRPRTLQIAAAAEAKPAERRALKSTNKKKSSNARKK